MNPSINLPLFTKGSLFFNVPSKQKKMLNCDGFNITQHRSLGIGIAQFSGTALIFWLHFMLDLLNYVVSDCLDLLSITK